MKGFLRRDLYLLTPTLLIGVVCALIAVVMEGRFGAGFDFMSVYLITYAMASVVGLFTYDESNHWQSYAAAVPDGRRDMVNARCLTVLALAVLMAAVQMLVGLMGRRGLTYPLVEMGVLLLFSAVEVPVSYKFGSGKTRIVMIAIVALTAAVLGGFAGMALFLDRSSSVAGAVSGESVGGSKSWALWLLPLAGLAALAVSRKISLGIMEKKEL